MTAPFEVLSGIPIPGSSWGKHTISTVVEKKKGKKPQKDAPRVVMGFKIVSNVPFVRKASVKKKRFRYEDVFKSLKVGESFRFSKKQRTSMRSLASRYGKLLGRQFSYRTKASGGGRLWRVK